MKLSIISIILIALLNSCSNPQKIEEDKSHFPSEAIEAGLPSIEKDWIPEDYKNFNIYLGTLSKNAYPKLNSEKSKDIFLKVVSSVNQPILTNYKLGINMRLPLGISLQEELLNIANKYINAHLGGVNYSMELSYLQGICIQMSLQIANLANEIIPTLDPNSPAYTNQIEGVQQMKNGLATQLDGTLISLQETETYTDEERRILATYLVENGLELLTFLDKSVKREFEIKLEKLIEKEKSEEIKKLLSGFYISL